MKIYECNSQAQEIYVSQVAKAVDCTYSHVVKQLSEMRKLGWVEVRKIGRIKIVSTTKLGMETAQACMIIDRNIRINKQHLNTCDTSI